MATRGMSAEQAFSELSRQSQNTNTKLRDLAARLVEREHARCRDPRTDRDPGRA